jgi:uncharacterized protein YjbI with pentapeptide repeats
MTTIPRLRGLAATSTLALALALTLIGSPADAATCAAGPGATCSGADLRGADLSGLDLTGADFRGAHLDGANLDRTVLAGADLSFASMTQVLMQHADLRRANLTGVDLHGSQLDFTDLAHADLDGVRAGSVDFAMTRLNGATARDGHFTSANFYGSVVHHTNFQDADLRHASFHGADFGGTDVSGADITGTVVTPSNIGDHPAIRNAFFDRIHTHVHAEGGKERPCTDGDSSHDSSVTCTGPNDDPKATVGLAGMVRFHWGQVHDHRRPFRVESAQDDPKIRIVGTADPGLASFHVTSVSGTAVAHGGHTSDHTGRGQVGGPLALNVTYEKGFWHPALPGQQHSGYSLTVIGWVQHGGVARMLG